MKTFLKKHIVPVWLWEDLRSFRKWKYRKNSNRIGPSIIHAFISFTKVLLKWRVYVHEPLDYSAKILLNITAPSELPRTYACSKEPETVEWIETHMKYGDVLYDIGANVGAYSLVAHAVTDGQCNIYAFEPSFNTFASLCNNIILNGFHHKITPLYVALSNKTEIASFCYADTTPGASQHTIVHPDANEASRGGEKVTHNVLSYRLDDLITSLKLPLPNHIKIDVDGTEYEILEGAKKTLSHSSMRSLLIEINELLDPEKNTQRFLEQCGFSVSSKHSRMGSKILFNYVFEKHKG